MAHITLYTEQEQSWFAAEAADKRGRTVAVDIMATTPEGAQNRLDASAKDYNLVDVDEVEYIADAATRSLL